MKISYNPVRNDFSIELEYQTIVMNKTDFCELVSRMEAVVKMADFAEANNIRLGFDITLAKHFQNPKHS